MDGEVKRAACSKAIQACVELCSGDSEAAMVSAKVVVEMLEMAGRVSQMQWSAYAIAHDLPSEWYGRVHVTERGQLVKIVGVNERRRKHPVNIELDGRDMRCGVEWLRSVFGVSGVSVDEPLLGECGPTNDVGMAE